MDDTVTKIADIRKRGHALVKQIAKAYPNDATVQRLAAVDKELCTALSAAVEQHGAAAGVSGPVAEASTAPKD